MADISSDRTLSRHATHARAWLLGALSVVLVLAIPNLRYPLGRDQATYCLIGQGLLRGQQLYRDLWDIKPPGIYYLYAVIVKAFGPVMWSVGLVDILWLLAFSCFLFRFAERSLGAPAAAISTLVYAAWHCTADYVHAAQAECFLTLCVLGAYLLLAVESPWPRSRHFAAGLTLGAAFWLKYNAVVFFPFVVSLPYLDFAGLDREPRRVGLRIPFRDFLLRAALVGAGLAAVVGGVLAYFWLAGAWPALVEDHFKVLPRYSGMFFRRAHHFWRWAVFMTHFQVGASTEAVALAAILIAWKRRELALVAPALLMALAGYATTAVQGRFHLYQFETCFPFLAVLWAYVCVKTYEGLRLARQAFARRGWRLAQLLTWVVLANLVYALAVREGFRTIEEYESFERWRQNPEVSYAEYLWQIPDEKLHDQMAVIAFLKKNSSPADEVYVWGIAPLINFLSQRRSPSRFVPNAALTSPWGLPGWRDELVGELTRARPRFVVVARHDSIPFITFSHADSEESLQSYPSLAAVIRGQYRPAVNLSDFEIYALNTR